MADLTLTQSFSMIALNAQDSLYITTVKKAALRCMAASVILEAYLDGVFIQTGNMLNIQFDSLEEYNSVPYREIILKKLAGRNMDSKGDMKWWLKKASGLSEMQLKKLERTIADSLAKIGLLEEIPGLLGCDLYYVSSGVEVREYRCNIQEYTRIAENIRAEILEDGPVDDEVICMLWLLRESGSIHDLFSRNELQKVACRMYELYRNSSLAKTLFTIKIHRGMEMAVKEFLRVKKAVFTTPLGSGVNFSFPILQRSQSVFIDTETMFPDADKRLEDVKNRLLSKGHEFTVLQRGPVSLIKIDNTVYEALPQAVICGKVPIHGVRLLPKHPF